MFWKGWWQRKIQCQASKARNGVGVESSDKSTAKTCAKGVISRFPELVPKSSEVEAFIRWMRQHNCTGKWRQDDLYEVYFESCQLAEFECLGPIRFGKGLAQVGCRRWREDLRKGGKGERIWMVSIPVAGDLASKPRDLASENRLPKPPKSIGKLGNSPLGRKPVRRVAYQ